MTAPATGTSTGHTVEEIQIPFMKQPARVVTYPSGHTFVFVPKSGDVFNISTWVKTGSLHEDEVNNGVSHFLEHLMFKGTERFKPGEFDRKMESMGAIINAATWKDFTFYYVTGPQGAQGENFKLALDMHADMLLHSTIPNEEVGPQYDPEAGDYAGEKRERSVVIEEIGMREDMPWTKVYNSVNHLMYQQGHPYQRDVIGTRKIIGTIPREEIIRYYHTWYSAPNMTTIVVGDFEFNQLQEWIPQYFDFSKVKRTVPPGESGPFVPIQPGATRVDEVKGEYQTRFFIMGAHGPAVDDLETTIALDVASCVLGEVRSSRLHQALVEQAKTPNFTSVSTGQSTFKLGNVMFVQGNFLSPDIEGSLNEVRQEIQGMLGPSPITEEEFSRAVKKLKVDFASTSETAAGISETIGESLTVSGSLKSYTHYLSTLEKLTLEKVQAVAKRYLDPANMYTSVLVPSNNG